MKRGALQKFKFALTAVLLLIAEVAFVPNVSHAATAGTGACQQTYTLTGTGDVTVYESGGYCYVAFRNTGAVDTQAIFSWTRPTQVTSVDALVVGGGGGGGARHGGGGGAGAFVQTDAYSISSSSSIAVAVGGGGGASTSYTGTTGQTSYFKPTTGSTSGLIALGGGGGANGTAGNGGSGGGAGSGQTPGSVTAQTQSTFAAVTLSNIAFGNVGAAGAYDTNDAGDLNDYWAGGGGGGANSSGSWPLSNGSPVTSFATGTSSTARGGTGGDGKSVTWLTTTVASNLSVGHTSSSTVYFAGGGGGGIGVDGLSGGAGGLGGGATGTRIETSGNAGTAHTGGGGGGSGFDDIAKAGSMTTVSAAPAGAGGSGVVVLRFIAPDITAPTISNISITSSSGADSIYGAAEVITATVIWSETVTITGSPRIAIVGLSSKFLTYASGSGTTTTTFTYTVVSGDVDRDGFSMDANSLALNGGTIADAVSNSAVLTHSAIVASLSNQVDGTPPSSPSLMTASDGSSLTLTYAETLSVTTAANTAFIVSVNGVTDTVTGTAIALKNLRLFLTFNITTSATVTLTYTDPTAGNDVNAIQDEAGNDAPSFTSASVTNISSAASNTTALIALNPVSATAVYRANTTIKVSVNTLGKVDFYMAGKIIPNCRNVSTSGNVANCVWKPALHAYVDLTARFRPSGAGFTNTTTSPLRVFVTGRSGNR